MARIVVDGMNLIGSRPDGWWRNRDAAVRSLLRALRRWVVVTGDHVTLALDGRPLGDVAEGDHDGVVVVYPAAPGGSADDRIVELVSGDPRPDAWQVVTSDGALGRRLGALGAGVVGAGAFRRRLDELAGRQ